MKITTPIIFLILVMLVSAVGAVATINPVTDVTNQRAVFSGTCNHAPCWFIWGKSGYYYWTTPNQTVTGAYTDQQLGSPMLTGATYGVKACDADGCTVGEQAFTVPAATMLPITHYGSDLLTIMRGGFNITQTANIIITPYARIMTADDSQSLVGAAGIVWGIFFFFVFAGYWLRGKGIMIPSMLAILTGGIIIANSAYSPWSNSMFFVDPMFVSMGIPLLVIGIAGIAFSWGTK